MSENNFFSNRKDKKNLINSIGVDSKKSSGKGKKLAAGFGVFWLLIILAFVAVYYFAISPALSLMKNVNVLKGDMDDIKQALAQRDLVSLDQHLTQTKTDIQQLQKDRDNKVGWMKDFGPTKEYYADSEHFAQAGFYVIDAGYEAIELMKPFADAGGFKVSQDQEVEELSLADAFAGWISIMPQIAQDIDPVLEKMSLAGTELSKVDASKYPESFRGITVRENIEYSQALLAQVNDSGPDIKEALTVIPPLLGINDDSEKRYMILMQNDKELRATGGFWTYVSTFKLKNAFPSSEFTSNGTYNVDFALDPIDPYYDFPDVPLAYRNHLKVERLFARDANISPDLPTAVDEFMTFWNLAADYNSDFKPVQGVFTIDTVVLEELLQVTGPVTLNGVTYNSETVTIELEKIASLALREQANRKKILGDLMDAMLVNVFESDKNLWPKLVEKGIDLANRKHIQGYMMEDEPAQRLIEKYNYAGRIVETKDGDYAFVVSTNLGGGKTNGWFVNKSVDHTLSKEGDRFVRTVTLNYKYGEKAPEFDPFKVRYQDWVRLYVPFGSELISVDGSEDEPGTGEERNRTYFHGYITVDPGTEKKLTFKYYLPENVVTSNEYKLYIQKQSGITNELHRVTVNGQTTNVDLLKDKTITKAL